MIALGDLAVITVDQCIPPGKLMDALFVMSKHLHEEYAQEDLFIKDISKRSCILCSLTVRDYLRRIGFERAKVRPCWFIIEACQDDKIVHSLGIGPKTQGNGWNGHMVVECNGWIIDTTLYQANRPAWPQLPGMVAMPVNRGKNLTATQTVAGVEKTLWKKYTLAGLEWTDENYRCTTVWLDDHKNKLWLAAPDAERERRLKCVNKLVDEFRQLGVWRKNDEIPHLRQSVGGGGS